MQNALTRTGIIVINTKLYPTHLEVASFLKKAIENSPPVPFLTLHVVDMGQPLPLHELYNQIADLYPFFIITLDLSGFELRTDSDGFSYNRIPCRMAHILLKEAGNYTGQLSDCMNFSMFFYAFPTVCQSLKTQYPNLLNLYVFPEYNTSSLRSYLQATLKDFFIRGKIH